MGQRNVAIFIPRYLIICEPSHLYIHPPPLNRNIYPLSNLAGGTPRVLNPGLNHFIYGNNIQLQISHQC